MYGLNEIIAINEKAHKDAIEKKRKSKTVEIPKPLFWNLLRSLDANDLQQAKKYADEMRGLLNL